MKRFLIALFITNMAYTPAHARLVTWCGGGIFTVDKKTGSQISSVKIPEMQLGGFAPLKLAVSNDRRVVEVVYGKCRANTDKKANSAWIPDEPTKEPWVNTAEIATATFITATLASTTPVTSAEWIVPLPATRPDFDTNIFSVGNKKFRFNEDTGQMCLLGSTARTSEWCYTIDPFSRQLRAGPSPRISVLDVPEGYLIVSNWFGAFLLDKTKGMAKWHMPYSNMDSVPVVTDAGDRWIFLPEQLMDNYR